MAQWSLANREEERTNRAEQSRAKRSQIQHDSCRNNDTYLGHLTEEEEEEEEEKEEEERRQTMAVVVVTNSE